MGDEKLSVEEANKIKRLTANKIKKYTHLKLMKELRVKAQRREQLERNQKMLDENKKQLIKHNVQCWRCEQVQKEEKEDFDKRIKTNLFQRWMEIRYQQRFCNKELPKECRFTN